MHVVFTSAKQEKYWQNSSQIMITNNYSLITVMYVCLVHFNMKLMLMPSWMIDDNLVSFSKNDSVTMTIIDPINGFSK